MSQPNLVTQVIEVAVGNTASLECSSNDDGHNFLFWQLGQNKIIGPGNEHDESKYKYHVLSGRLMIKGVTPEESGYYRCVSKNLNDDSLNIGAVEMLVNSGGQIAINSSNNNTDSDIEAVKIILIIISLLVLAVCGFMLYRLKKAEKNQKVRLAALDDDDDEGSGDEIYNRTTTSIIDDAIPGTSKIPKENVAGIDNKGLDTNFNAAFEQISINSASRNLV